MHVTANECLKCLPIHHVKEKLESEKGRARGRVRDGERERVNERGQQRRASRIGERARVNKRRRASEGKREIASKV